VTERYIKTKPSFLEAGLPCASLSAESQRDNNARQRPPQNRLHIWWARRPPTVCRAAILAALLPFDLRLDASVLPPVVPEPTTEDLTGLSRKYEPQRAFFEHILADIGPTEMPPASHVFLRALEILGDADRAYRRLAAAEGANNGQNITLGSVWGYRHERAFAITPTRELLAELHRVIRGMFEMRPDEPITILDFMAGGGTIPLEGVRYGFKVHANDLNPVAATVLKATMEYPARFGNALVPHIERYAHEIDARVRERLSRYFPFQPASEWWPEEQASATAKFSSRSILNREPAEDQEAKKNTYLWLRTVPCPGCALNIPLAGNYSLVTGRGNDDTAAFPEVPRYGSGNDCTFRIVRKAEWGACVWPRPGFTEWHPSNTPTYDDGKALCPRCGRVVDGDEVKTVAQARPGGLAAQLYVVCSQVPVRLTYRKGESKVRSLWRFRAPLAADLAAVRAAEEELQRRLPHWEAAGLVPDEEIEPGDETLRMRNMGMRQWRDLFAPRQLLTNMTVLEEIRAAQARVQAELPPAEAEAVCVYLAFILSKVVNYNSVNTFWDYTRRKVTQTFSRHDFAFRPAFGEFEGARETVLWGAAQVIGAYDALARLIHGQNVTLDGADDEDGDADEPAADEGDDAGAGVAGGASGAFVLRPEVIPPTITCNDAAALAEPPPGSVHLLCVDPPYYNNVQYSELSNFFYVWLKRSLRDVHGLAPLFAEPLAESGREAVANNSRWAAAAAADRARWQASHDAALARERAAGRRVGEARTAALAAAGPKPPTTRERADRFYEDKMTAVFSRARSLLHPAGRMVVMFNHRETNAWRSLGMALIRAGFEIRSSAPIHTEAESSLNIHGLDAARSTVLLLCLPREEREQPVGNWGATQTRVGQVARNAAALFGRQGLRGTDLYLSALGPALGEVARNWPVTDFAGRAIDLGVALDAAYAAVGHWRLEGIQREIFSRAEFADLDSFNAPDVDRDTQTLWLWLDTFAGEQASSDDVRKLSKALNVDPADFERMGLVSKKKDLYLLSGPADLNLGALARRLQGLPALSGRAAREQTDAWEERAFPNFLGAAVWNAIALMVGADADARGPEALRHWLRTSGYAARREFRGAFAVTLSLLEETFGRRALTDPWKATAVQARRVWDLALAAGRR
jgi:adenine-specific DNA methylase